MKSLKINVGDTAFAQQYNDLRDDAKGGSFLLPHQQSTPDLTLKVESGACYVGATRVIFAGGNSPAFTAPTTNPRIDLLTINSVGILAIIQGTEAASPTPPAYPSDKLVLCEVYNRVGQISIRDTDTAGQGYIYNDVRPFLGGAYISVAAQVADGIITDAKLVSTFVHLGGSVVETITGVKTFGSIPILPASDPTAANEAARKAYVDTQVMNAVRGTIVDKNNVDLSVGNNDTVVTHGLGKTPKLIIINAFLAAGGATSSGYRRGVAGYISAGTLAFSFMSNDGIDPTFYTGVEFDAEGIGTNRTRLQISIVSVGATTFTFRITRTDTGGASSSVTTINWTCL